MDDRDVTTTVEPTIQRRDAVRVAVAATASAASGLLVLALAARVLRPDEAATAFYTFWSAIFACFGILTGLSIETTRAVSSSLAQPSTDTRRPRVLTVGLVLGGGLAVLLAGTSPLWSGRVFPTDAAILGLLVSIGVAGCAVHAVTVGSLGGVRAWGPYAGLIGLESAVRVVLVGVAAVLGATVRGFAWGVALATFTWLAFVVLSPRTRRAVATRADSSWRVLTRRIAAAGVATGASALLVVGFPTLLAVTTDPAEYSGAAPLLLALTLTRAPLMIPLNAYQGVAVAHFVGHRDRGLRALAPIARLVGAVGGLGVVLAYLVGPWLMRLVEPSYHVPGEVLAGLVLAATLLALITLTGALCQALNLHRFFVAGWLVALVVALLVLLVPLGLPLAPRAVLALTVGPTAGLAVHLLALRRRA